MEFRSAFTLLELLSTLAIVAVLTALGLPALSQAQGRAASVLCSANFHQWGVATQIYCNDNQDFLPPDGTPNPGPASTNVGWYVQLPNTMGWAPYSVLPWRTNSSMKPPISVWLCPSNRRRSNGRNLFHYCLNQSVNGTGTDSRPVRLSWIESPSSLVWLFDSKNLPAVGPSSYTHTNLHSRGAHFLFLDGHSTRYTATRYWDFSSGRPKSNDLPFRWEP